jgi:hypothetical protein
MEAKPQLEQSMQEQQIRAALDQHWAASDANDFETEHRIYHEDAVLEYPQSGVIPSRMRCHAVRCLGIAHRLAEGFYSSRRAAMGSSRAARCAGR